MTVDALRRLGGFAPGLVALRGQRALRAIDRGLLHQVQVLIDCADEGAISASCMVPNAVVEVLV